MKASKIVIAVVIIAIAGYIASKYFGARASAVDKKAQWYIKLDKNADGSLTIDELKVMDAAAISVCKENSLPIVVFNLRQAGNIRRVVMGEPIGTTVVSRREEA